MDPLSDVLSVLRPEAYITGAVSAGGAWSLKLPAYRGIKCYMVAKGECWLSIENADAPVKMREGTCILLPHGLPFVIASDLNLPPVDAREVIASVARYNGVLTVCPGEDFLVLGSHFDLSGDASFLLKALPSVVAVEDQRQQAWMKSAVERILWEMKNPLPGGELIAQQAAYAILIDALRLHLSDADERTPGWLGALADERIRHALAIIHDDPSHPWTLTRLSHRIGMSRTAFAQSFKNLVGETPMAYLARWRMTIAANRLRGKREAISQIATAVGYQSESSFSAAFRRQWGISPSQHARKTAQEMETDEKRG